MRDGWTETTLGDIAEVNMGQSPPGDTYNTEGIGMPFMQGSAEFGEHYPEPVKFCSAPAKVAEIGDLLLSVRAPVGDSNFANQRIAIGRGLATVRAKTGANTNFLRLVIQLNTAGLLATSGTGMFSSITGKNLREFGVDLPPLDEQRRIVDVVASVNAYIDALQQKADTARTARNAVLHELLSAGGDDWTETTLGEIVTLQYGKPLKAENRDGKGFPVFGSAGEVGLHSEPSVNEAPVIVVGRKGTAGAVWWSDLPCSVIDTAFYVEQKVETDIRFLYFVLGFLNLPSLNAQTGVPGLNRDRAYSSRLLLPPLDEQKRIVDVVSSMDEVIQSTEQAVEDAKNLRSGLLSDLLSGEHEIPASYDEFLQVA